MEHEIAASLPTPRVERGAERALFVLDAHTFAAMRDGEPPRVPYSHDRNVLLLAHVAAKRGMEILVCAGVEAARRRVWRQVSGIYPCWRYAEATAGAGVDAGATFAMVACAGIEMLHLRDAFPGARIVGLLPALHMFEAPSLPPPERVHDFIVALRSQVDFVITQNTRMRDGLAWLSHWLARWDPGARLLVAPLGLSADMRDVFDADSPPARAERRERREACGLAPSDVLIVNAGGAWHWTDCDTFIEAMCLHARAGGRVRAYFSGLSQPDNHEINTVRDRILALTRDYPECFGERVTEGRPVTLEMDWARGGREVGGMLRAGDLGLGVSKTGFENWQSHRVRVIDYLGAGLPILAAGDDLLTREFCDKRLRARPGEVDSYRDILAALEDGRLSDLAALRREAARRARALLDGEAIHGAALAQVMAMPARSAAEIAALPPGFIQLIERQFDARVRDDLSFRLRALIAA